MESDRRRGKLSPFLWKIAVDSRLGPRHIPAAFNPENDCALQPARGGNRGLQAVEKED
jgi:hypothetical protein